MQQPQAALTAPLSPGVVGRRGDASQSAWPAVAAWGAALILLALGAGAITAADGSGPSDASAVGASAAAASAAGSWAVGLPLIALGAAGLVWGGLTLARGRLVAPRAAVAGTLVGLVAGGAALGVDPVRTSVAAFGAVTVLLVAVALGCGRALRSTERGPDAAPRRRLAGLLVAAVVVAGIVTPALGATEAGRSAGHSGHGIVLEGGHSH